MEDQKPFRHFFTEINLEKLIKANEGKMPKEIELMKVGQFQSFEYGEFEITPADLVGFVESYERGIRAKGENGEDRDLPINCRHDRYGEAAGWIKGLRETGGSLMATVEWTELGIDKISKKLYKYISPEWYFVYEDETSGQMYRNVIVGAGLTNVPLFQKLKPLTSSEGSVILFSNEAKVNQNSMKLTDLVTKELSELSQDEKDFIKAHEAELDADAKTKFAELLKADEGDGHDDDDNNEEGGEGNPEPKTANEGKKPNAKGQVVMTASEYQAMNSRITQLEASERENRIKEKVRLMTATATTPNKLLPAQRDTAVQLLTAAESAGKRVFEAAQAFINSLPNQDFGGEKGEAGNEPLTASEKINKLVSKYQEANEGADYRTALNAVKKQNPALFEDYAESLNEE